MINSVEFTERLQKVIDFYGESASGFAEKIGVQRSSISHILSGRNKPSLDFVMKVLHSYPEVELYWLMNGKGEFPNKSKISESPNSNITETRLKPKATIEEYSSEIEKIVVFYKDGTFKAISPKIDLAIHYLCINISNEANSLSFITATTCKLLHCRTQLF